MIITRELVFVYPPRSTLKAPSSTPYISQLLYNYDQLFGSRDAWRLLKRWSTLQVALGRVTNTKTLHFTIWNQSTTPIFSIQISFVIQPERIFGIIIDFHGNFLNFLALPDRGKIGPYLSHSSKLFGTRDILKISSLQRGPWRVTWRLGRNCTVFA